MWFPRLTAGIFAIFAVTKLHLDTYVSIMLLLSVSHTILAAYYSRTRFSQALEKGSFQMAGVALLLATAGVCIYLDSFRMYYLVLVHHVLNEVYSSFIAEEGHRKDLLVFNLFLGFEILLFIVCAPGDFAAAFFPVGSVDLLICQGLLFVAISALALRRRVMNSSFFVFLLIGLGFSSYSTFIETLNLDFLIMYHFTFWLIFPALKAWTYQKKIDRAYWVQTAAIALMCVPFTLLLPTTMSLSVDQMSYVTRALAYYHIFTTFAVSTSNPAFVTNFFQKARMQLRGTNE